MFRSMYGIGLLVSLLACSKPPTPPRSFVQARQFLKEYHEAHPIPALAIALVTPDSTLIYSEGVSDRHTNSRLTDSSVFFAGPVSEIMLASLVLKLQREQRLTVQDRVVQHLPYFQMQGEYAAITVHHLLTHTSGIPHFNPAWDMPAYDAQALEATTRSIVFQEVEFRPGTQCKRSPYNYDVAADLLEKVTGQSLETLVSSQLLEPYGLRHSAFSPLAFDTAQLVKPSRVSNWLTYEMGDEAFYPYTRENAGSFGFHTTVTDLATWVRMLLQKRQDPEVWRFLMARHYQTGPQQYRGYGWEIVEKEGSYLYQTSWSLNGFSGHLLLVPETGHGVVVLANVSDDFDPSILGHHLLGFLNGTDLPTVSPPGHIALGRMLAMGTPIDQVLAMADSVRNLSNPPFQVSVAALCQLTVNLLYRVERPTEALAVATFAADRFPEAALAHLNLAEVLLISQELTRAQAHLDQAGCLLNGAPNEHFQFLEERLSVAQETAAAL